MDAAKRGVRAQGTRRLAKSDIGESCFLVHSFLSGRVSCQSVSAINVTSIVVGPERAEALGGGVRCGAMASVGGGNGNAKATSSSSLPKPSTVVTNGDGKRGEGIEVPRNRANLKGTGDTSSDSAGPTTHPRSGKQLWGLESVQAVVAAPNPAKQQRSLFMSAYKSMKRAAGIKSRKRASLDADEKTNSSKLNDAWSNGDAEGDAGTVVDTGKYAPGTSLNTDEKVRSTGIRHADPQRTLTHKAYLDALKLALPRDVKFDRESGANGGASTSSTTSMVSKHKDGARDDADAVDFGVFFAADTGAEHKEGGVLPDAPKPSPALGLVRQGFKNTMRELVGDMRKRHEGACHTARGMLVSLHRLDELEPSAVAFGRVQRRADAAFWTGLPPVKMPCEFSEPRVSKTELGPMVNASIEAEREPRIARDSIPENFGETYLPTKTALLSPKRKPPSAAVVARRFTANAETNFAFFPTDPRSDRQQSHSAPVSPSWQNTHTLSQGAQNQQRSPTRASSPHFTDRSNGYLTHGMNHLGGNARLLLDMETQNTRNAVADLRHSHRRGGDKIQHGFWDSHPAPNESRPSTSPNLVARVTLAGSRVKLPLSITKRLEKVIRNGSDDSDDSDDSLEHSPVPKTWVSGRGGSRFGATTTHENGMGNRGMGNQSDNTSPSEAAVTAQRARLAASATRSRNGFAMKERDTSASRNGDAFFAQTSRDDRDETSPAETSPVVRSRRPGDLDSVREMRRRLQRTYEKEARDMKRTGELVKEFETRNPVRTETAFRTVSNAPRYVLQRDSSPSPPRRGGTSRMNKQSEEDVWEDRLAKLGGFDSFQDVPSGGAPPMNVAQARLKAAYAMDRASLLDDDDEKDEMKFQPDSNSNSDALVAAPGLFRGVMGSPATAQAGFDALSRRRDARRAAQANAETKPWTAGRGGR